MKRVGRLLILVCVLLACGCAQKHEDSKQENKQNAELRIVAVGSAVTEIVYELGAGGAVVGVDTSSLYPEATAALPKVGYQRTLAAEGILSLRPTMMLASGEAGPPAVLDQMKSAGVRVELFPVDPTLDAVRARITRVAEVLQKDPAPVLAKLDAELGKARSEVAATKDRPRVLALYARGAHNVHVFGEHTTTQAMIELAGGENAVSGFEGSKPLSAEAIVKAAPDVILLPSRGLDSLGGCDAVLAIPGVEATPAAKTRRVVAIDDLLLLGFGPRTGRAVSELSAKLHPGAGTP